MELAAAGALVAGAALLYGLYALIYYKFVAATRCRNSVSLRGKTVLITGGNSGIGKATAVDLARRGARVILTCRNKAKGESAVYDIRQESGNSEVILMILDLGNLNSVRAFAQTFLASEPRLDILINNAGQPLGPLPADPPAPEPTEALRPEQDVIVASTLHSFGKIDFWTIYKPWKGYDANSKLANILHARELAKQLKGTNVTCYVVDPGFVQTEIGPSYPVCILGDSVIKLFLRDWKTGAQTIFYCATEEGIERLSGRYFVDCQPKESGNSEVILMILDLGNLNSAQLLRDLLSIEPRLDILINNAGRRKGGRLRGGIVNHLGHFLLTHLLLNRLKHCAPSRIVIVASTLHSFGKIDFWTIYKPVERMWQTLRSYANSKLANILHARELAKQLKGTNVTCYVVDPGFVQTEIGRSYPRFAFWVIRVIKLFLRDWKTGAQTIFYCATEEGIERLSGRYFVDCQPK
ncbi:hypothetical protein E2320_018052, partial [Naja naja]